MEILRKETVEALSQLSRRDLMWMKKAVRRETHRRWLERRALDERLAAGFRGLANALAGVTWALACRQSLRRSKGHEPDTGSRPASGEMWLPRELLYALRHEVKERTWSPLGARSWAEVLGHLQVENGRRTAPVLDDGELHVAQFHVRMAPPTYAVARMGFDVDF